MNIRPALTATALRRTASVVAVGLAAVTIAPGVAATAAEKLQEVVVRNTDAEPVPTKAIGTTTVDATGSAVTLQGTPSVSIAGTPQVTVANAAAVPQPFQRTVRMSVIGDDQFGCADVPTPAGALTRVENVSVTVFRSSNASVTRVFVRAHNSAGLSSQELPLVTTTGNNQTAIQPTLLYAGVVGGDQHSISVCLNVLGGHGGAATAIVSGTTTAT